MSNPYYPYYYLGYISIILKLIRVAVIEVCWETPFSKKSY